MEWVLVVILWLAVGWLPSRLMKHYFTSKFYMMDDGGWGVFGECLAVFIALFGPVGLVATLIPWLDFTSDRPKGWRW